jgi:proton glutamate symport protein
MDKQTKSLIKTLVSILLATLFASLYLKFNLPLAWNQRYIKPVGILFLNALKLISIPLVITSLIVGVNGLEDTSRITKIAGKTAVIYTLTTIAAVCLGLLLSNVIEPGKQYLLGSAPINPDIAPVSLSKTKDFALEQLLPDNLFRALTDNSNLLFIVIFCIIFGLCMTGIAPTKKKVALQFFEACNDIFTEMIQVIMAWAPIGIFAIIAGVLIEKGAEDSESLRHYFKGILYYTSTVVIGLGIMMFLIYPLLVYLYSNVSTSKFMKIMSPVQAMGFSTGSSTATLPFTMKQVQEKLGVSEEISSFVLPLGATVNMDGTAMYQAIAVTCIAQAFGIELSWTQQVGIISFITLSSIGAAGIPGASLGFTSVLLNTLGIPATGISLIMPVDNLLDRLRTATNITGDAVVATIIDASENKARKK